MPVVFDIAAQNEAPTSGSIVYDAPAQAAGRIEYDDGFRAPADLQISAYNPTLRDRTRNFLQPLSDIITKLGTVPRNMPQIPQIPDVSEYSYLDPRLPALAAAGNTAIGLVNQLPTPLGVALTLGGAPAKVAGGLLSPIMAQHAADNLQPTIETIQNPNATPQQKIEAGLGEATAALGAAAPLAGLRRGPLQQVTDYGTITPEVMAEPTRQLALPEPLAARVSEKTPEQAVKAIREHIKVIKSKEVLAQSDLKKIEQLTDVADRLDRQITERSAAAEKQQSVIDAHDAQAKFIQDQSDAAQQAVDDQKKAQDNAQKLALAQAKAQGEQTQAIMEAQTPPELLQAQKPMVLANSASQIAKNIEDNPESAQAQLNAMTKTQPPAAAQLQNPTPNALQIQGPTPQVLLQPEAQPQNPLAVSGVGNGNAQPEGTAGAGAKEEPFVEFSAPTRLRDWLASANKGAFTPDSQGLIPDKNVIPLLKKLGVSKAEMDLYPDLQRAGSGRTSIVALADKLEQSAKIETKKLFPIGDDYGPAAGASPFQVYQHELETRGFSAMNNLGTLEDPAGTIWTSGEHGVLFAQEEYEGPKTPVDASEVPSDVEKYFELRSKHGAEGGAGPSEDAATGKYGVEPKQLKDMPGAVDILVRVPHKPVNDPFLSPISSRGEWMKDKQEGVFYKGPHFGASDKNVLASVRGYVETLPNGEKAFHVFEVQSDWGQSVAKDKKNDYVRQTYGGSPKDHPLLAVHEQLAAKAAIDHARKIGAKYVAISDAETAMMTEGHDRYLQTARHSDFVEEHKRPASQGALSGADGALFNRLVDKVSELNKNDDGYVYHIASGKSGTSDYFGIWKTKKGIISQESGMRAAYDKRLPAIMQKLTGDKGKVVEFGAHKASQIEVQGHPYIPASGSPVFRDAKGKPKTQITARLYDITKSPKKLAAFGYSEPSIFKKGKASPVVQPGTIAPAKFIGVQEGIPGNPKFPASDLYTLTKGIEGHPEGSSVFGTTLEKMGYKLPEKKLLPADPALLDSAEFKPKPDSGKVTIVSAALKMKDGQVFTGPNHASILEKIDNNFDAVEDDGFVTSKGKFVSREEAMKIAKGAGQMLKNSKEGSPLFIEHLDPATNVLPKKTGLTVEDLKPQSPVDEPTQTAPAQETPGATGFVPDRVADPATDFQPGDNLENRRKGAARRQQRGAASADVVGSAGGAAASGAYGYLSAHKRDDETEEQFQTRRLLRAFAFGLGGGIAGSSAIRLLGKSAPIRNAETLVKVQNEAKGIDTVPQWYQKLRQTGPMVKFREAINNSRAIVKDIVGNAAQAGTEMTDQMNPYATGKVYAAKVAEAQRKAGVVMDDLQKGVVAAGKASGIGVDNFINRFNIWLEARHTPYYNQHLANLHAASGDPGLPPVGRLSDAEAAQVLADAKTDGLEPVFNNLATGYKGVITSIRDLLEDGGLITPETRKAWETKFPEYVPMNRIMPDADTDSAIIGHIGGGPGISVLGAGVKKITGSNLDVSDIAGNLMANWTDAITRVEKNEVAKSAGLFFKNLEFDGNPYEGVDVRKPKVIGTAGDHPIFEPFKPENMVSYMVKGKPNWIVFRDPKIATAFSNLNPESQNRLMRIIATPTRIMSRAFTGYNLDFLVPNLVRDRQSAAWKAISQGDTSGALQQINPGSMVSDPGVVSQWIAGKQNPDTQLFQQMMDDGGMPGGYASSTRQKSQDFVELLRKADTNPLVWGVQKTRQAFNFLSEISEGSTRFRAYKRALELGATRQEAAVQALNSSIDFNQKGTVTPSLGAFYAFFNPSAQGGVNAVKNLLRSKDAMAVLLAGLVGVGAAVDTWNKGFDPDWKKRKSFAYARTNGIPIIYGTDPQTKELKYFSIPLSQEVRPVKAVADFANEFSNGDIRSGDNLKDELGRVGGAIVSASNPLGADPLTHPLTTVTPTVGRPLLEIASNRDFADRPIIPDRLHDSPLIQPQAQRKIETYDARTGRMAIALADLLKSHFNVEVSPEHMKYLVNSYGGGPARTVSSTINSVGGSDTGFKASDLPVVGSFFRRTTAEGLEKTTPLYKNTEQQLSDAKTAGELASQQSKLFFRHTFDKLEPSQWAPFWRAAEAQGLIPKDMTFRKQIINDLTDKIKGRGDVDKLVSQFSVENGERASYYASRKRDFKTEQEYLKYLQDQAAKKLLTPQMVPQIRAYLEATK